MSESSGALSDEGFMSLNSEPLVSHSLWKLYSLFLLVGERGFIRRLPVLSGRKNAKSRERITDPAPNRNGAPDTMVWAKKDTSQAFIIIFYHILALNLSGGAHLNYKNHERN